MKVIKNFEGFNFRRYGNPWVAKVGTDARIDFSQKIGGYTGGYNRGEAGQLYVEYPAEGQIYAYGQKDYRKPQKSYTTYVKFTGEEFIKIEKTNLISELTNN